jgi:predicted metal-binding protein
MILALRSRWEGAVLVCSKCEKKLGKKGFGEDGRQRLSKLLRRQAGRGKGRKAALGIVSTGCLNVCPKRGVTLIDGRRPGEWLVVPAGTPLEEVEARLLREPMMAADQP